MLDKYAATTYVRYSWTDCPPVLKAFITAHNHVHAPIKLVVIGETERTCNVTMAAANREEMEGDPTWWGFYVGGIVGNERRGYRLTKTLTPARALCLLLRAPAGADQGPHGGS
jgi:hypothetical protein